MGLLVVALLFPTWFFVQSMFSPAQGEDASELLLASGLWMPILFVIVPVAILAYWKVDVQRTLALKMPSTRHVAAAVLVGLSAWIPAHELNVLQHRLLGVPQAVLDSAEILGRTLHALPASSVFVLIAVIPAVCEELLFRGFLLSSLSSASRKWTAIIASAAVFAVFHFFLFKFAVTALLGVLLGYLCWQSRSIVPAIIVHLLHNGIGAAYALFPDRLGWLGAGRDDEWAHLPAHILLIGGLLFALGLLITSWSARPKLERPVAAIADG
jgi:ABC-2 type transport system permease protein/sodium transport system permease protein